MRRTIALCLVLAACSSGTVGTTTSRGPASEPTTSTTIPRGGGAPASSSTTTSTIPTDETPLRDDWLVITVTGQLPEELMDDLADLPGISATSVVWLGNAHVVATAAADGTVVDEAPDGYAIPVELHAIDPEAHRSFVPEEVHAILTTLAPDEVALGESSAGFRRIGVGGTLTLEDGTLLTVAAVIPDRWIGSAEMVTTREDAVALGADRPRYAVVRHQGARDGFARAAAARSDDPVKVRSEAEVGILRHANAVQPQIAIKVRFGEFAFRPARGRSIEIDPAWVEANIVTVPAPFYGEIRCHREFAPMLIAVLERLAEEDRPIIDPDAYLGCWNPRFVTGRRDLSRHAWGVAVDLNFGNPLDGPGSPVDPALLAAMQDEGLTSGHDWTIPDPGHFEWYGPGA